MSIYNLPNVYGYYDDYNIYNFSLNDSMPAVMENYSYTMNPFFVKNPSLCMMDTVSFNNNTFTCIDSKFNLNTNNTNFWNINTFMIPHFQSWVTPRIGSSSNHSDGNAALGKKMVENASYYVNKVNDKATGNRLFSGGKSQAWCADFVTAITKQTLGDKFPADFGKAKRNKTYYGSCSVFGLRYWAEDHNCYQSLPTNYNEKCEFIAKNIKPGDIMIEKLHTGIVTKVYPDGSFDTVEGNYANKVAEVTDHRRNRHSDMDKVVGFISLSKIA